MDQHHLGSKPKIIEKLHDQLRFVNRGDRNSSHDSGNLAFTKVFQIVNKILTLLFRVSS